MKSILLILLLLLPAPALAQCRNCVPRPTWQLVAPPGYKVQEQLVLRRSIFGGPYYARQVVLVPDS